MFDICLTSEQTYLFFFFFFFFLHEPHVVVLQVVASSLRGRVWEGKYHLIITLRNVSVHCAQIMNESQKEQVI